MIKSKVNGLVLEPHNNFVAEITKLGQGKFAEYNSRGKSQSKSADKKAKEEVIVKPAEEETEKL